ncbi:MAG: DMT family transporter [Candidatus Heimdallarchaeota archaeon]
MVLEESLGVLLALSAATAWGAAVVMSKSALKIDHSLAMVMVIRGTFAVPFIATLAILAFGMESILRFFQADVFWLMVLSSIFVGIGDFSLFSALKRVEVSKAQPITSVYPLFTAIILILFGVETITEFVLLGTLSIVSGVALISTQRSSVQEQGTSIETIGLLLSIGAAFFWSFAILTLRMVLTFSGVQVLGLATVRFAMMTILMAGLWLIQTYLLPQFSNKKEIRPLNIGKRDTIVLGIGGLVTWGIGGVAFFYSIDIIGAARATPISSINPLIAVLLGILILKERLTRIHTLGILLVTLGVIFISIFH